MHYCVLFLSQLPRLNDIIASILHTAVINVLSVESYLPSFSELHCSSFHSHQSKL